MKNRTRWVVAAAAVSFLFAMVFAFGQRNGPAVIPGHFILKQTVNRYSPDGTSVSRRVIYRSASDGSFRRIETDGTSIFQDSGFTQGRGYFVVDYNTRTLVRRAEQSLSRRPIAFTPEVWTKDSRYVGSEQILGLTAYLIREVDSQGRPVVEAWMAPETGGVPLRQREYRDGQLAISQEPYALEFREPEAEFIHLPDFPVKNEAGQTHTPDGK